MKYQVKIVDAQTAFDNAHAHVISTYHDLDVDRLRKHFETEIGVKIVRDPGFGHWTDLIFANQEAYTMFVLKWS